MTVTTQAGISIGQQALNQLLEAIPKFEKAPWEYEYKDSRYSAGPRRISHVEHAETLAEVESRFSRREWHVGAWVAIYEALDEIPEDVVADLWAHLEQQYPPMVPHELKRRVGLASLENPVARNGIVTVTASLRFEGD